MEFANADRQLSPFAVFTANVRPSDNRVEFADLNVWSWAEFKLQY